LSNARDVTFGSTAAVVARLNRAILPTEYKNRITGPTRPGDDVEARCARRLRYKFASSNARTHMAQTPERTMSSRVNSITGTDSICDLIRWITVRKPLA